MIARVFPSSDDTTIARTDNRRQSRFMDDNQVTKECADWQVNTIISAIKGPGVDGIIRSATIKL